MSYLKILSEYKQSLFTNPLPISKINISEEIYNECMYGYNL
jgi:hypothetical protein